MSDTGKLSVVLAGCGGISNAWMQPVKMFDDIEIIGLADLDIANAESIKQKYNLENAATGTDLHCMLKALKPDAVFDCTVPEAHCQITIEALAHGCHVLGEKPMATNMSAARQMVEAAARANRIYAVIQNRRYTDSIIGYKETVKSGGIGALTTLNADFYLGPHFGGFREKMKHVLLQDMAIHTFDQARFISGADALAVYCYEWNPAGAWFSHGASALAIFEMTNGLVFSYRGSWCAQGLPTSWESQWRAIGTEGTATWDGGEKVDCETITNQEGFFFKTKRQPPATPEPLENGSHAALIREFADCVKNGKTPQTVCTDNIKSLAMVEAAIESAETNQKVIIQQETVSI